MKNSTVLTPPPGQAGKASSYDLPADEASRLQDLYSFNILDTDPEADFDRLTRMARILFGVKVAAISFVDDTRQWFKSISGFNCAETPREYAFCAHTIGRDSVLVVPNTLNDPTFDGNPLVTGPPKIRFYAGAPLVTRKGTKIGAFCIIDDKPRDAWTPPQSSLLTDFANMAVDLLRYRALLQKHNLLTEEVDDLRLRLAYRLETDSATGLPNRSNFEDAVNHAILKTDTTGQRIAVFSVHFNNMQELAEKMGHKVGDQVLQEMVTRLQRRIRQTDLLVRSGERDFLVLFTELRSIEDVNSIRHSLIELLSQPVPIQASWVQFQPQVAIGSGVYPDQVLTASDLIAQAEHQASSS